MFGRIKTRLAYRKKRRNFLAQLKAFHASADSTSRRFQSDELIIRPFLDDNTPVTQFDRHYVFHIAWACRVVKEINPAVHIDFSSSLHFCTTLSAFVPTKFYDYRPADIAMDGLESLQGDLTNINLPDNSVASLSCMHTVEHVGLGRYGDPIDYDGDLKAIRELKRIVRPDGSLLFVVPIGKPKIQFNAQRIYSYDMVMSYFGGFELKEFSLIPESGHGAGLIRNASKQQADEESFGCGCFWFIKK